MAKTLTKNKQMVQYREVLREKAQEVRRNISSLAASEIVACRQEPNDMVDLAGQSHEEWLFLNRNAQNIALLRQVNEALERIDEGTYSVCAGCDRPISPKRLAAVPWAKYCIACQEKHGSWTN
jgi:DnaK suppressor protein